MAEHLAICILLRGFFILFSHAGRGKRLWGLLTVPFSCPCFRLNPKNVHQRPTVALLCGPHVKGAQGISCGRHLSNHDVHVILFLPNFVKMLESITNELNLFSKTQGQQVSSVKGERPSRAGTRGCSGTACRLPWHHLVALPARLAACPGPGGQQALRATTEKHLCCHRCFLREQSWKSSRMELCPRDKGLPCAASWGCQGTGGQLLLQAWSQLC